MIHRIGMNRIVAILSVMAVSVWAFAAVSNVGTGALATSSTAKSADGLTYAVNTGVYGTGSTWAGSVVLGSASKPADGFRAQATSVTFPDAKTADVVFVGQTQDGRPVLGSETVKVVDAAQHKGTVSALATVGVNKVSLTDQPCTVNVVAPAGTPTPQPVVP